ncbi:MAG: transglutaminase family protein [Verrucomicrobiales bacterium]|nr:transglutaminase family protein [Verrucomicrobiales bacterium]
MKFSIHSSLDYVVSNPATILCSLSCVTTEGQFVLEEKLSTNREADLSEIALGLTSNRYYVASVNEPGDFSLNYEALVDSCPRTKGYQSVQDSRINSLDADTIPFLFPSRYCQSDLFRDEASRIFGQIRGQLATAIAVESWLKQEIEYISGASNEGSSALETFQNQSGVCRDFAHLGIAMCRALTIPARYVTVYAHGLTPQDFHAVCEVYVGGQWYVMDGTGLAPLNGMVRIGTGRDASDAAVATLFGGVGGAGVSVQSDVADSETEEFIPVFRDDLLQRDEVLYLL